MQCSAVHGIYPFLLIPLNFASLNRIDFPFEELLDVLLDSLLGFLLHYVVHDLLYDLLLDFLLDILTLFI